LIRVSHTRICAALQPHSLLRTVPTPWPPGTEPSDAPRFIAIAEAAKELDEKRRARLDPPGASDADLKKRTLTNLYNEHPTWLRNLLTASNAPSGPPTPDPKKKYGPGFRKS